MLRDARISGGDYAGDVAHKTHRIMVWRMIDNWSDQELLSIFVQHSTFGTTVALPEHDAWSNTHPERQWKLFDHGW